MGVMDNNMVHTETSMVKSLSNGDEKRGVTRVLQNGGVYNVDTMTGIKFKRRKVFAVRDFPPGCGSIGMQRKWKTTMEAESFENGNVAEDDDKVVAKKEENLGERDDEQDCNRMDESNALMVVAPEDGGLLENAGDVELAEPVEVQPLDMCLPNADVVAGSVGGESEVDVVRDVSATTGSKCPNSEQCVTVDVSMGKNLVLENSGSAGVSSSGTDNMVRDIVVVYADEESLGRDNLDQTEPLEIEMSNYVTVIPKPSLVVEGRRKKAKKGVAIHSALKLTKKIHREYGEGSRKKKKSERVGRDSPSRPSGSSSGDMLQFSNFTQLQVQSKTQPSTLPLEFSIEALDSKLGF